MRCPCPPDVRRQPHVIPQGEQFVDVDEPAHIIVRPLREHEYTCARSRRSDMSHRFGAPLQYT